MSKSFEKRIVIPNTELMENVMSLSKMSFGDFYKNFVTLSTEILNTLIVINGGIDGNSKESKLNHPLTIERLEALLNFQSSMSSAIIDKLHQSS